MTVRVEPTFDVLFEGTSEPYIVERRVVGRTPFGMMRATRPAGDYSDAPIDDLMLTRVLRVEKPVTRDFGAGALRHLPPPDVFELAPRRVQTTILAEGRTEVECAALPFDAMRGLAAEAAPAFTGDFGRLHDRPFQDPLLKQLVRQLWAESADDGPHANLMVDSLLMGITAQLLRLAQMAAPARDGASRPLEPATLEKVYSYIEEQLTANVTCEDLAQLCGLSRFQFSRAFKAAAGMPPHAYVLERRLNRAHELLAKGQASLADIAYACGFSSQSHMTDMFRRKVGVTPRRYRDQVADSERRNKTPPT